MVALKVFIEWFDATKFHVYVIFKAETTFNVPLQKCLTTESKVNDHYQKTTNPAAVSHPDS